MNEPIRRIERVGIDRGVPPALGVHRVERRDPDEQREERRHGAPEYTELVLHEKGKPPAQMPVKPDTTGPVAEVFEHVSEQSGDHLGQAGTYSLQGRLRQAALQPRTVAATPPAPVQPTPILPQHGPEEQGHDGGGIDIKV